MSCHWHPCSPQTRRELCGSQRGWRFCAHELCGSTNDSGLYCCRVRSAYHRLTDCVQDCDRFVSYSDYCVCQDGDRNTERNSYTIKPPTRCSLDISTGFRDFFSTIIVIITIGIAITVANLIAKEQHNARADIVVAYIIWRHILDKHTTGVFCISDCQEQFIYKHCVLNAQKQQ